VTFTVLFRLDPEAGWLIANTGLDRHAALALCETLERQGYAVELEPLL